MKTGPVASAARSAALVALAASACTEPPSSSAPPAPSAPLSPSASAWPPADEPPYAGKWSGSYDSTFRRLDVPVLLGGLPEWTSQPGEDDASQEGIGKGTLSVHVDAGGLARGVAEGVLGAQVAIGMADAAGVTLSLTPGELRGFAGTLVARRDGLRLVGTLTASTGDSRLVRVAALVLTRVP